MNTLRRQIFPALVVLQLCLIPVYTAVIAHIVHAADRDPMERAQAIWGKAAEIQTDRIGDGPTIYRVGCHLPTKAEPSGFIEAGEGVTIDEALQKVDYSKNGAPQSTPWYIPPLVVQQGKLTVQCQSSGMKP